ncbi:MAG: hypothetical protein H6698_06205 [Myxococcales bacterium]|nr:hypothetical protein [Myxococcales bacterium]MCB9531931.1 hypothetical protein [Myxococcales bacterium]MCB9533899.1 hypothetical protein [Myxococcales bacterium]
MTADDAKLKRARARLDASLMDAARPLDALLPELALPAVPREPVHPRVLETAAGSSFEWVVLVWEDPGGARALHEAVKTLVEATLLAELSRTPAQGRATPRKAPAQLRVVVYPRLGYEVAPALRAFGFRPAPAGPPLGAANPRVAAEEARRSGRNFEAYGEPTAWTATIESADGTLGRRLEEIQEMMAARMGDDVWGRTPGGPSRLFAVYAQQLFGERIEASSAGLDVVQLLLLRDTPGVIRWLPPLVFQALCDFVAVVIASTGAGVAWGESEDAGGGFYQPPLFRVGEGDSAQFVEVGRHVLQWWMMPIEAGEQVPTLREWVADIVGGR